jgi:murein DD-endopeptidase MepM/ murein hydrolase activator NlpD
MWLDALPLRPSRVRARPLPPLADRFGLRSVGQVARDLAEVARDGLRGARFQVDLGSAGLLRPDLALPAYAGLIPAGGRAPIFTLFDRHGGGRRYTQRVSRKSARDFRGGRLTYDEHDGTDFVCPVGTPLVAAAPGTVVMVRDRWLRGGLTVAVDHGAGVVTQYTHCSRAVAPLGTVLRRGEPVALSGSSGIDMTQFFPWVPPHVHFMVYVDGAPVDPFLAPGEAPRAGTWLSPNDPTPSGSLSGDPDGDATSEVDGDAVQAAVAACTDPAIQGEIAECRGVPAYLAALLEDALAHDRHGFAFTGPRPASVRPAKSAEREARARAIGLTLPLPAEGYVGARFADSRWTSPPLVTSRGA